MLGRSIPEYIFIRICVSCLRAITPLSIIYTTYCLGLQIWGHSFYSTHLAIYAGLEASFYFLVYLPRYQRLQEVRIRFSFFLYSVFVLCGTLQEEDIL